LSKAFGYLIRIIIFHFDNSFLNQDIFLYFILGMNIVDWNAILIAIIFQTILFSVGMNFNKTLIRISALIVYLGLIIFFFSVFLSDVKFTTNAFLNTLSFKNFLDSNNIAPLITVAGTIFAYFAIVILTFGDFSRYVKNEHELNKGNLSLILNLIIFSFFTLFIVIGTDAFLKANSDELSRILTNPTDLIGKLDNFLITNLALIFIIVASASTNLIVNFVPSQYTLINLIPSSLSLKSSSIIIACLSFVVSIFWLTYLSQIGVLSFIDTFGSFFGPLFGIMIVDYYFVKRGSLINKDIYSLESNGAYFYSAGWHIKGVYSLILGFIFSGSTIWNVNLMFLQSYSWILGALVSALTYFLLAKK